VVCCYWNHATGITQTPRGGLSACCLVASECNGWSAEAHGSEPLTVKTEASGSSPALQHEVLKIDGLSDLVRVAQYNHKSTCLILILVILYPSRIVWYLFLGQLPSFFLFYLIINLADCSRFHGWTDSSAERPQRPRYRVHEMRRSTGMAGERSVMMNGLREISLIAMSFSFLSGRPDSLVGGRSFHVLPRTCLLQIQFLSSSSCYYQLALLLPLVSYALRSKLFSFVLN
jgi:hypothetical protein